ncbi:LemA family protein [archaeon]|nr:LemA family protein [archaeon]
MSTLWIILIIVAVIVFFLIVMYNRLINLKNRIENAWSQIDVQLKRRYNLIPNLVKAVKGYMKHEKTLLENITKARSSLVNGSVQEKAKSSNMVSDALKSIFAVAENYPDLKASKNFQMLQEELSGTENKIAYARQFYNDSVMSFNTAIQKFPTNMMANILGFKDKEFFKTEGKERKVVDVNF